MGSEQSGPVDGGGGGGGGGGRKPYVSTKDAQAARSQAHGSTTNTNTSNVSASTTAAGSRSGGGEGRQCKPQTNGSGNAQNNAGNYQGASSSSLTPTLVVRDRGGVSSNPTPPPASSSSSNTLRNGGGGGGGGGVNTSVASNSNANKKSTATPMGSTSNTHDNPFLLSSGAGSPTTNGEMYKLSEGRNQPNWNLNEEDEDGSGETVDMAASAAFVVNPNARNQKLGDTIVKTRPSEHPSLNTLPTPSSPPPAPPPTSRPATATAPSTVTTATSSSAVDPLQPTRPARLTKEGIAAIAFNYTKPPLGNGGFSVVHQGEYNGKTAAVKVLKIRNDHELKMFEEELRAMLNPALWHINVCPLLAYCREAPAFVFPKLTALNVERMVRLPDDVKDSICIDVANGLWHLHKAGYVHFDMKPDNVLLLFDDQRRIQKALVGDLGCVKSTSIPVLPYGTIVFLDPQLKFDQLRNPHPADDVYSLGITFLSIWINRVPTMREEIPLMLGILKQVDTFRYTMIKSMLHTDLMQRPTLGYVRDVMKARQKHLWAKKGYPWSARVPPVTQPPFIGENAAARAAANGHHYVSPVQAQQQVVRSIQQPQQQVQFISATGRNVGFQHNHLQQQHAIIRQQQAALQQTQLAAQRQHQQQAFRYV